MHQIREDQNTSTVASTSYEKKKNSFLIKSTHPFECKIPSYSAASGLGHPKSAVAPPDAFNISGQLNVLKWWSLMLHWRCPQEEKEPQQLCSCMSSSTSLWMFRRDFHVASKSESTQEVVLARLTSPLSHSGATKQVSQRPTGVCEFQQKNRQIICVESMNMFPVIMGYYSKHRIGFSSDFHQISVGGLHF